MPITVEALFPAKRNQRALFRTSFGRINLKLRLPNMEPNTSPFVPRQWLSMFVLMRRGFSMALASSRVQGNQIEASSNVEAFGSEYFWVYKAKCRNGLSLQLSASPTFLALSTLIPIRTSFFTHSTTNYSYTKAGLLITWSSHIILHHFHRRPIFNII